MEWVRIFTGVGIAILYILFEPVHPINSSKGELSILESLTRLLAKRPTHLPWIPSIAYEKTLKNEYQQRQFIKDRLYEQQIDLTLADLHSQLVGTSKAHQFFINAAVYGIPNYDNLKFYDDFILSYDNRLKQPVWSLEHLTKSHFRDRYAMRPRKIGRRRPDKNLHRLFQSHRNDYKCSHYNPVYFAASINHRSNQRSTNQSYRSTNTAPQASSLNHFGPWNRLEGYVAYLAARSNNTYVVTGTLYKPPRGTKHLRYGIIGTNRVAVPTHYYKVILSENSRGYLSIEAFAIPNSPRVDELIELEQFRIDAENDLDKLEDVAVLKFFDILDRSKLIMPVNYQLGYVEVFDPSKRVYKTIVGE